MVTPSRGKKPLGLLLALLAAAVLAGCLKKEELTARATGPAQVSGPSCSACHPYPLTDTNHTYHLFDAGIVKKVNGFITCIDCHATALAFRTVSRPDSIFTDPIGNEWSSLDFPNDAEIRKYALTRVDTVVQDQPIPAPVREGEKPLYEEYVTSLAHMNGKVDVVFNPRVTDLNLYEDTSKYHGAKPEWMPEKETCSAVACHPAVDTPYWRFEDKAKGLRELVGLSGDVP